MVLPGRIVPSCFSVPLSSRRLLVLLVLLLPPLTIAKFQSGPSSVSIPASWNVNKPSDFNKTDFDLDFKVVLCRLNSGPSFFFGFNCFGGGWCSFGVHIFQPTRDMIKIQPLRVWEASQQNVVVDIVQVVLTPKGDLVLLGDDRKEVWSSNTAGKSVVGLNLTEVGNLVLYDRNDAIVWQSFNHPAHAILPKQVLRPGMRLTSSSVTVDRTELVYTFAIDDKMGFVASVRANQSPRIYYRTKNVSKMNSNSGQVGALFNSGTFGELTFLPTSSAQYIGLLGDGTLNRYVYDELSSIWKQTDLLGDQIQKCDYPLGCGNYGICLYSSDCECPSETKPFGTRLPSAGCYRISPFSCASHSNTFVKVENITHFALLNDDISANISSATAESCKEECLRKGCSCTMALFRRKANFSGGDCYFLSDPFSLKAITEDSTIAFIKVKKRKGRTMLILVTTIGAVSMFLLSIFGIYILSQLRRNNLENDDPDLPKLQITRFHLKDLKAMTEDFNNKLGEGGFGSVFLGTLPDGVKIAVKRLDGLGHIKKSFLAEAETIGTIHHINLVRLLGFCAEKSHRLLVYEYMCNGSLDKWIFHNQEYDICWQVRRKIIIDIAKGLAYLHEDCHQKIIHLDIKPQNILLDEHFNAKLADFGLSKLIDKDQSHVMTTMRGTPGYLAPEWLSSVITEKVDVYSFGIVMLEVLCGRKNVDRSLPSDEMHLLTLFKCKAEQERLLDLLDKSSGDIQLDAQEATKMMKIATWCLQDDCSRRPPMSQVVKCLEGSVDIEEGLSHSFSILSSHNGDNIDDATQLLPSQLSGPR